MTAGEPMTLYFDTKNASAFYAFIVTERTRVASVKELPIVSLFLPLEVHYTNGYKISVQPQILTFNVSSSNNHIINFFGPPESLLQDLIVQINVQTAD